MTLTDAFRLVDEAPPGLPGDSLAHSSAERFPARPVTTSWPATGLDRAGVLGLVSPALPGVEGSKTRTVARRGLCRMLDFLEDQHPHGAVARHQGDGHLTRRSTSGQPERMGPGSASNE